MWREQAIIEWSRRVISIVACSRHIYIVLLFTHTPFVVNHTINATPPERLQQQLSILVLYIENIHFSLIKPNPNPKQEHKRINPTGPIKSMTHDQCHQSCKGESRTQDHLNTKLGSFRSTTKVLLLTWQSLAFYLNRVVAADLCCSHFLWAGTFIMFFQMKFKFSKKIQTVHDFLQNLFF